MKHIFQKQTIETHNAIANKYNTLCNGKQMIYKCNHKQTNKTM